MKIFVLLAGLFCCINLSAQSNSIAIGLGSSGTSRISNFSTSNFSSIELSELRRLETIKPSFQGELGYSIEKNENIFFRVGFGYRHTRFGSGIYTIPDSIHNATPQSSRIKKVVMQNQKYAFFEASFNKLNLLKSSSIFCKVMLIHNNSNYEIYEPTYDKNNKPLIIGLRGGTSFVPHRLDFNLSMGFNYTLLNKPKYTLLVQPFCSLFLRPYTVYGEYYSYLPFNKNTVGHLWDFGILVQYKFQINNK